MPWLPKVNGLMQAWFLGSETGHAIADVISGDVNPSGKLPFTFPVELEDNSAHHYGELSYPGDNVNQYYKEGIYVGYRWHDTKKVKPLFAFGHGLSYSSFEISNAKADKEIYTAGEQIRLTCKVSNTGKVDGAEVVQVYVGKVDSKVERAMKELKAFQKVTVSSGDKKAVKLIIDVDDLAFYDESISDWNLEKGTYEIYVGNASDNISETLKITIK
jgi:beta-glucosidase